MIIHPHQTEHFYLLGGKARALADLADVGCDIPSWFAVTELSDDIQDEIMRCAADLGAEFFAVRSSARGEDGVEHSFAGQYDTFLYVEKDDLIEKIRKVRESDQSDHLKTYQSSKEIDHAHKPTALIQAMLSPDVSGVAFSADPVSGNRSHAVVSGLWGTGSALVSGEADADAWTIDEDYQVVDTTIANKAQQHIADANSDEGVALTEVPEKKT